ncbi:MAG: hypothetical protein ABR503_12500, partial [Chitinophagaceae bacterium]
NDRTKHLVILFYPSFTYCWGLLSVFF